MHIVNSKVIDIDQADANRVEELEEQQFILQNLREIACGSDEGETVRLALISLYSTKIGRDYLEENPIRL